MSADVALVTPPAAELSRNRTLLVGTAFAAVASIMVFVGLFAVYIAIRQNNEFLVENRLGGSLWFPEGAVQIAPGTFMMFTTWISAFTISWAVQAIRNDDRRNAYVALGLTVLMGAAIINQMAFAIGDFGLPVDRSTPALMLYVIYGSYMVFMSIAVVFVLLMAIRAIAGQFNSKNADGVQAAAIYWYATVIVYLPVWYLITITK
ncbi:MAG: heme/copper-type cytochrome/quinol oxidase subunit 3 [Verrucomicrobiales bacterium]|jgi:heme/copper-type cytochrome/quinol oxidase subunit 3